MLNNLYGHGVLRFATSTIATWLLAMIFVYLVGGRASINQWSALGALASPAIWLLWCLIRNLLKR